MKNFPFVTSKVMQAIFRILCGGIMMAHGTIRIHLGTVGGFGEFLNSKGFMIGTILAWLITIIEIAGGFALAAGFFVRWICLWFSLELLMGIVLVHAPNGWFVVGATSGGMEYSVLLVASFLLVASYEKS